MKRNTAMKMQQKMKRNTTIKMQQKNKLSSHVESQSINNTTVIAQSINNTIVIPQISKYIQIRNILKIIIISSLSYNRVKTNQNDAHYIINEMIDNIYNYFRKIGIRNTRGYIYYIHNICNIIYEHMHKVFLISQYELFTDIHKQYKSLDIFGYFASKIDWYKVDSDLYTEINNKLKNFPELRNINDTLCARFYYPHNSHIMQSIDKKEQVINTTQLLEQYILFNYLDDFANIIKEAAFDNNMEADDVKELFDLKLSPKYMPQYLWVPLLHSQYSDILTR